MTEEFIQSIKTAAAQENKDSEDVSTVACKRPRLGVDSA